MSVLKINRDVLQAKINNESSDIDYIRKFTSNLDQKVINNIFTDIGK